MSPGANAVDRSLLRLRGLVGCALVVLAVWLLRDGSRRSAVAMLAGAIAVPSIVVVEQAVRRVWGLVTASIVVIAADTGVVFGLLWATGQRPDSVAAFAVALPLIEAGVRHGVRGLIVAWLSTSFLIAGWTAIEWGDLSLTAQDPLTAIGLLLLIALPAAHMADHLVDRVEQYAHAHAQADHRSELLATVLRSAADLIVPEIDEVEARLITSAATLAAADTRIVPDDADTTDSDIAAAARLHDGAAVQLDNDTGATIAVWLGPRWQACLVSHIPAHPHPATGEALEVLGAYARIAHSAAEQHAHARQDAEQWARQARTDPLTGLLNRAGLLELLDQQLHDPAVGPITVVFLDLDGLKQINDLYGHDEGDTLIRGVADRIRTSFPTAPAARLGGDEFVIVLPAHPNGLSHTIAAVREQIATPHHATTRIDISVGAATTPPDRTCHAAELVRQADAQMYIDKHHRRAAAATPPPGRHAR